MITKQSLIKFLSIFLWFSILACSPEYNEDDSKRIKELEEQCTEYEEQIESFKNKSQKSTDSLKLENEKLQFQKDSITSKYNQLVNINLFQSSDDYIYKKYTKGLPIEAKAKDEYWDRGFYYASEKEGEMLYHVTTGLRNDSIYFLFMGIVMEKELSQPAYAKIYELNEDKEIFVIDSFKFIMPTFISRPEISYYLEDFSHRNNDNLIINGGTLYYYKETEERLWEDTYLDTWQKRECYSYSIGSKNEPLKLKGFYFSNNVQEGTGTYQFLISPAKSLLVSNFCSSLDFYHIANWNNALVSIFGKGDINTYRNESIYKPLGFDFDSTFNAYNKSILDSANSDLHDDESPIIGGFCWHPQKNIVYFDNSGVCYACIWKVDLDNSSIEKIVPEHEAIHPHFFATATNEYVAYVEENKIMLSKVPEDIEE